MDRRSLLAVTLCFLIFMAWQKFYLEPRMPKTPPAGVTAPVAAPEKSMGTQTISEVSTAPTKTNVTRQSMELDVATGKTTFSNGPHFIDNWTLSHYVEKRNSEKHEIDLRDVAHDDQQLRLAFDSDNYSYLNQAWGNLTKSPEGIEWKYSDSKVSLRKTVRESSDQTHLEMTLSGEFKESPPKYIFLSVLSRPKTDDHEEADRGLGYWDAQEKKYHFLKASSEVELAQIAGNPKWIGAMNRYFLFAVVPSGDLPANGLIQPLKDTGGGKLSLTFPVSGNKFSIPLKVYFGPKDLNLIRSVEPTLDHSVDFGWFTVIAYPILWFMKWLYGFFFNYGWAIVVLTIILKILLYPLTYKSAKSMKEMAKMQPQLQKIREKYKDDKEALNREMMTLMRTKGYNPMAGCLPILIQMPIFFALYRVLYSSVELYQAPFLGWIQDLSLKDPYYVTPVLLTGLMFLQQKLTPSTATDPAQQKMLQFMPIMFGVFMITLPSGLTIYMLTNSIASIIQQVILNKKFGTSAKSLAAAT